MSRILLLAFACLLFVRSEVQAHSMFTSFLDMVEAADGTTAVSWRRPVLPGTPLTLAPLFPAAVTRISADPVRDEGTFTRERFVLRGAPAGWSGQILGLSGTSLAGMEVLLRLQLADGRVHLAVLRNPSDRYLVPLQPTWWQAAASYLRLGFDHILLGFDHLLFVLGLLVIVRDRMTLLKTITAFTVAHSLTLAAATLGFASAPMPPLNLAIALSIFFLAPEIVRQARGGTSLTLQRPWLVAFAFGLLHGFGFASGLSALGLPKSELPLALLLFNVGVELGQLLFVAALLLAVRSFRVLEIHWPRWVLALPCYTVGSLGAFWTLDRAVILFRSIR